MYTWRPPLVSLSLSTSEESRVGRRCVFFVAGIESQGVSVWPVWGGPLFHSRNFRNLLMFTNPLSGVYCSDHWFQHRLVLGWFLYREEKYGPSPVCSTGFFHMQLHPPRLTWNLKMMVWKMFLLFQGARILRFHVNLARCIFLTGWVGTTHHRKDKLFGHIFPKETHMTNKRIHARWSWRSILSWLILNKCLPIFLFQIRPRKTNGWTPTDPPKVVGKQRNDSKPTIIFSVFCHSFSWV